MFRRLWPLIPPVIASAAVVLIGLQLPVWKRWVRDGAIVREEKVSVGRGLIERREPLPGKDYFTRDANRKVLLGVLTAGALAGAVAYGVSRLCLRIRPTEAADYSDGPGGALPDGRAFNET